MSRSDASTEWLSAGVRSDVDDSVVSKVSEPESYATSFWYKFVLCVGLMIAGAFYHVSQAFVFNSKSRPCEGCPKTAFEGRQLIQLGESLGSTLLLIVFYLDQWFCRTVLKKVDGSLDGVGLGDPRKPRAPWYQWILPALADYFANSLFYYAATMMTVTQVQIFRPFRLLLIAIISMAWFRRDIKVHCWIGIIVLLIALVCTTVDEAIMSKSGSIERESNHLFYGVLCSLGGVVLLTGELVLFEHIARHYYINPIRAVGCMGVIGIFIAGSLILISHFTGIENFWRTTYQLNHSTTLRTCAVWIVLSITTMNIMSLAVTATTSSLFAATLLALEVIPVYIVEVVMGWLALSALGLISVLTNILGILLYAGTPLKLCRQENKFRRYMDARLHLICDVVPREEDEDSEELEQLASETTASGSQELYIPQQEEMKRSPVILESPVLYIERLSSSA